MPQPDRRFDGHSYVSGSETWEEMTAFTFGTEDSDDVMIASGLAASAGYLSDGLPLG